MMDGNHGVVPEPRKVLPARRVEVTKMLGGYVPEPGEDEQKSANAVPIGTCPKCGVPVYTEVGFCGSCKGT